MELELDAALREWRDTVRRFADQRLRPTRREREAAHATPLAVIRELAALGLLGVNVPTALGGSARGPLAYVLAVREVAEADAAVAVTMAVSNMVAEVITRFGSEAQKTAFVPRITGGEMIGGAFALSEAGAGSDPGGMTTRAERRGERWLVNGEKLWITTGDGSDAIVLWARTGGPGPKGISCFLLDGRRPGFAAGKPEEKMGLWASHTVSLTFSDVELAGDALLGELGGGFKIAMMALDGGRIGVAAQALGIAYGALARVRELLTRPTAHQALAHEQGVQFQLADVATELEAAWLLVLRAAWLKGQNRPFSREAAMAKVMATESANRAVRVCVEIAGGLGYLEDEVTARALRDCRVTQIYEGTSEIQRLVISRDVLRGAHA